jgi:hypothetical protein
LFLASAAFGATPAVAQPDLKARISPKLGDPATVFRVGFTAPKAAWPGVAYSVALSASGSGCKQDVSQDVTKAKAGERVRVRFTPSEPWCRGRGRVLVYMHEWQPCAPPFDMCPGSPEFSRVIARIRFSVR